MAIGDVGESAFFFLLFCFFGKSGLKHRKSPMWTGFGNRGGLDAAHVSDPPRLMGDLPPGQHSQMLGGIKAGLINGRKNNMHESVFFYVCLFLISVLLMSLS